MFRSASLLIVLAFALGLWIGFNPEAHLSAEKSWAEAKASIAALGVRFKPSVGHLFVNNEKSPPPSRPPGTPDIVDQVGTTLKQLAASLEQLWNEFLARARSA